MLIRKRLGYGLNVSFAPAITDRMAGATPNTRRSGGELFIVDNSEEDWKVRSYLTEWCEIARSIDIATGYFEIGALLCLEEKWQTVEALRILMG